MYRLKDFHFNCLELIETKYINQKEEFLNQLKLANFETINKLLYAIIRENIFEQQKKEEEKDFKLNENENYYFIFKTKNQLNPIMKLKIPINQVYSLNRFSISDFPSLIINNSNENNNQEIILDNCFNLIELFKESTVDYNEEYINEYKIEIENSIGNQALINTISKLNHNNIKKQSIMNQYNSVIDYVNNQHHSFDSSLFYEQLYTKGHLTHTTPKMRKGFTPIQVLNYSSELSNFVNLHFIAIKKQYSLSSSSSSKIPNTNNNSNYLKEEEEDDYDVVDVDDDEYLFKYYPNSKKSIIEYMNKVSINYNDYNYHLIHPWQNENIIPTLFKNELSQSIIVLIPIEIASVCSKPLISLRTAVIFPELNDDKLMPHIKVPININITCALRTISSQSANNGPIFSEIIRDIYKREYQSFFGNEINFLSETYGCWFNPLDINDKSIKHKSITNIWRENPNILLENINNNNNNNNSSSSSNQKYKDHYKQQIIVSCSLYSISPITNKLILFELIDGFIENKQKEKQFIAQNNNDNKELVFNWFNSYISKLLTVTIVFMSKYGIGLEAHLQNTLWVIDSETFEPVKLICKDWAGSRLNLKRLSSQSIQYNYKEGSATICGGGGGGGGEVVDESIEMYNKVQHSVFNSNIGELILSISKYYNIMEIEMWKSVSLICKSIFNKLKLQHQQQKQEQQQHEKDDHFLKQLLHDENVLFSKNIDAKSLTKMRLQTDNKENITTSIINPLYNI
ncbi:hypothetical protein ACTFIR_001096 [Dictyostelium discoideum]